MTEDDLMPGAKKKAPLTKSGVDTVRLKKDAKKDMKEFNRAADASAKAKDSKSFAKAHDKTMDIGVRAFSRADSLDKARKGKL